MPPLKSHPSPTPTGPTSPTGPSPTPRRARRQRASDFALAFQVRPQRIYLAAGGRADHAEAVELAAIYCQRYLDRHPQRRAQATAAFRDWLG